jgi:hypothetical protein
VTLRTTVLVPSMGVLMCTLAAGGEPARGAAPSSPEMQASSLKELSSAVFSKGGFLAWALPALCDQDENAYLLLVPPVRGGGNGANAASGPHNPRAVLRVSADGKKRTTFDPLTNSKFANATDLTTNAMALDGNGTLFLLVWARWAANLGQPEKGGQYIVSFDRKGEYKSSLEVDWQEILVSQFEVFGSGDFLLRGRRAHPAESRLAILSASGQTLTDVASWSNTLVDEPTPETPPKLKFDHLARGGDGRIYLIEEDPGQEADFVHAISPSGQGERLFKLPSMPSKPRLMGWKVAGDRFAAVYESPAPSGERSSRWWIAVYTHLANEAEPETTVYGPAPGVPICYEHDRSGDRFIFLAGGKLVSMSP